MTNSVRNIYLTKTINSAEFVYCKLWRNWLFSHVKFAAEWNVDYIGGGILTTFLRSFGITYRKKKRGKNENLKPERVFHPSASVCVHQRVWKTGGKKRKFLPHSHKCLFFQRFFFFFFFYWKVAGVSSFFFFDIIAMEVIIKWEDDSDSSLPASQSGIIGRVVVRRHRIRYLAAISPRRWPFFSHIFFLPLFLIK